MRTNALLFKSLSLQYNKPGHFSPDAYRVVSGGRIRGTWEAVRRVVPKPAIAITDTGGRAKGGPKSGNCPNQHQGSREGWSQKAEFKGSVLRQWILIMVKSGLMSMHKNIFHRAFLKFMILHNSRAFYKRIANTLQCHLSKGISFVNLCSLLIFAI